MEQDFFTYLPPEITINILSRLPVRATISCKCVRKSWRRLLETPEFVKSRKSVPGLAVFQGKTSSMPYKVFEFVDELDPEYSKHRCNEVFNFSFPHPELIHSSANGLLLLFFPEDRPHNISICNPVTRDYIKLPRPHVHKSKWELQLDTFGFGISKMTGQYKVVRVFHEGYETENPNRWFGSIESKCQVYTLGTGSWRSIATSGRLRYECHTVGACMSGNFHWLVSDVEGSLWISCFDLETEVFSTFSAPHLPEIERDRDIFRSLSVLRDCLCLCDNSYKFEISIWLMSTYGDEKSWTKQFIIPKRKPRSDFYGLICAVKVFEDGDILITKEGWSKLACYSNKTETVEKTDLVESNNVGDWISAVSYTPTFLPLKTFTMENVSSF